MLPGAVLLDLDGTLVDSESVHAEGIARCLARRGVDISAAERDFVIGHAWQEIYDRLDVRRRADIDLATLQAGTAAEEEAMRAEGIDIEVLAGARELVDLIDALAVPQCIVSGSSVAEIERAVAQLGFADKLAFYLGAEDYPRGKPAPDGFLTAAARLRVDPERCLVVEDSRAGIDAARAAGMRVIATSAANLPPNHSGHQDQRRAHRIVASLSEIGEGVLREVMSTRR